MIDYTNFDAVFGDAPSPYSRRTIQEIDARRKAFGGVLFIDRVLRALGINKAKIYPPKSESSLHSLHQQICDTEISVHHRLSVFYYILLDYEDNEARNAVSDVAEAFAHEAGVPAKYQVMMRGLWNLDHGQFEAALEFITHPSLTPDFADPILTTLVHHADPAVALQYYHTVRPVVTSSDAISSLFSAMAQTSVAQAFFFSRTFPEHTREQLLYELVSSVLGSTAAVTAKTNGHAEDDQPEEPELSADRARELALLPFDSVEEAWFEDYLERGQGRRLRWAKDALVVRRVAGGRFAEARATEGLSGHWATVLAGLR